MVDHILYIQQLTYNLRKKSQRIIELCQENSHLALENGSLKKENEHLQYLLQELQKELDYEKQRA